MDKKEITFIHYAKKEIKTLVDPKKLKVGPKPNALWFGCNEDWSKFVEEEMDGIQYKHKYSAIIDFSNIIILKTKKDIINFTNKFVEKEASEKLAKEMVKNIPNKKMKDYYFKFYKTFIIDWERVKNETKAYGIFIQDAHIKSLRLTIGWYYTVDVCSIAIWDKRAISFMKEEKL
jgi:hypothetical protein